MKELDVATRAWEPLRRERPRGCCLQWLQEDAGAILLVVLIAAALCAVAHNDGVAVFYPVLVVPSVLVLPILKDERVGFGLGK